MKKAIRFKSKTCQLASVREAVRRFLQESGHDECEAELIVLALDEACTNIIRHAYCHAPRPVLLRMERGQGVLRFVLRDFGTPCDPRKIRGRELEDVRPGGLGVHIIRKAFDRVEYAPLRRGTRLVLEKFTGTGDLSRKA